MVTIFVNFKKGYQCCPFHTTSIWKERKEKKIKKKETYNLSNIMRVNGHVKYQVQIAHIHTILLSMP